MPPTITFRFRGKDGNVVRSAVHQGTKVSREFYLKHRGKPIPPDALAAEGKRMAELERKTRKPRAA